MPPVNGGWVAGSLFTTSSKSLNHNVIVLKQYKPLEVIHSQMCILVRSYNQETCNGNLEITPSTESSEV